MQDKSAAHVVPAPSSTQQGAQGPSGDKGESQSLRGGENVEKH